MIEHAYLLPLIAFFASLIMLFAGKEDPRSPLPWLGIGAMAACLTIAVSIFWSAAFGGVVLPYEHNWRWFSLAASIGGKSFIVDMSVGTLIDGPAAVTPVGVTLVSLLVPLYPVAYMHDDARYKRYFARSFFTAAMLGPSSRAIARDLRFAGS